MDADDNLLRDAIETVGAVARKDSCRGLPHPATTNQLLAQHLSRVTGHPLTQFSPSDGSQSSDSSNQLQARLRRKARALTAPPGQQTVNGLFVHSLHQLDHRSTHNQRELFELRALVEQLAARVGELEGRQ